MENTFFEKLPQERQEKLMAFDRLLTIMDELREQCPWDKKQTMDSLRHLTIEETYELSDAILEQNLPEIKKELGDVMLHLVFYAKIASETNIFNIADVLNSVCEKLIGRHPHIYPDKNGEKISVENEEQVKQNWERLKLKEGNKSVLGGVPNSLPALIKAMRIQEKARGVGFDWDDKSLVWAKVEEEIAEFKHEIVKENHEKSQKEFGDVLFSLVNYARFVEINPETALEQTNKKFIKRFMYIENQAQKQGKSIQDLRFEEMDSYWNEAKKQ